MKMNNETLKTLVLSQLAEENVAEKQLSMTQVASMVDKIFIQKKASQHRYRIAGISASVFLILLGVFFILTPSGYATAEAILNFFTKQSTDDRKSTIVAQNREILPSTSDATMESSESAVYPQIIIPEDFVDDLSESKAEELAGFTLINDDAIPDGYTLEAVSFNMKTNGITRMYLWNGQSGTDGIVLIQQTVDDPLPIGSSSNVEYYQLGSVMVEAVQGGWFALAQSKVETWVSASPMETYRWLQDGFLFTVQFVYNEVTDPGYLSGSSQLRLVGLLSGTDENPPRRWNLNNLAITDVRDIADFPVLLPAQPLNGLVFDHAVYEAGVPRLVLLYEPESLNLQMRVFEVPIAQTVNDPEIGLLPAEAVQEVMLGSVPALYQRGAMVNGNYDPNFSVSLQWKTETTAINLVVYSLNQGEAPAISRDEVIDFALNLH